MYIYIYTYKYRGRDARFHAPQQYCELLKSLGVSAVVRLNEADTYSPASFTESGT